MTEMTEEAARALRSALGAEHAAVWVYGLASAFVSESRVRSALDEAMSAHRAQRDEADKLVRDSGQTPPAAQPAYDVGQSLSDQTSAIRVLAKVEHDCQVGWRSVLENSEDPGLRRTALNGLTTAATRATRWRLTIGERPAAPEFPGQP
ncbi:uncharacterized protein DUF4439 [Saccharopolyspora erythraea NRRL 2338]|uniref:Uncharacterized protein n=3 Tax=Saccharopolyspora erythraea TaxID=1836 RepID=A4FM38_SACEN|nr:ferritin [Saccharopolyspora erythraea D]PFG98752.1 uncharacterized protein DUF4439 [Saccharopolyspora erythraea NRRL 2338]QRK88759.1 ferritin-like domain-containing protein [Saccharopolyspora erythraea]CAM05113.1 hypothetical protein SACE_5930 [Saccharopolyspora erythraea NRRL 2338]